MKTRVSPPGQVKLSLFACLWVFFCGGGISLSAQTPAPDLAANPAAEVSGLNPDLPTVFIAGDSTAAKNNGNPTQGWAVPFAEFFDPARVNVANHARGGRSSRTFITEGLWDKLIAQVKAGDVVLIQFGHNDGGAINEEPPGSTRPLRARGTLPGLGMQEEEIDNVLTGKREIVRTYGWYVRRMIADVRARRATPVLVSLTLRNIWKDGFIERGSGRYREWLRALSASEQVELVDLSRLLADAYQVAGAETVAAYFGTDHTHTNTVGARLNAAQVVAGLRGLKRVSVEPWLSDAGRSVAADTLGWLNLPEPSRDGRRALFLIGDSTVRNGRGDGANGEWGWGDFLAEKLAESRWEVVNRAMGARSSRTFLTEGNWDRLLLLARKGDLVLIQFGENDASPVNDERRARGTLPGVGEESQEIDNLLTKQRETVHTFGWYLRRYVREARQHGLVPVLCSPIPQRKWSEGAVPRREKTYQGWARAVAEAEGVPLIDLSEFSAWRLEQLGQAALASVFVDSVHTNAIGAGINADVVAEELHRQKLLETRE